LEKLFNQVTDYLNKNPLQNVPAITAIGRGNSEIVALDEGGVILYEKALGIYFVSLDDNSLFDKVYDCIKDKLDTVVALREKNINYIAEIMKPDAIVNCYQAVYKEPCAKPYDVDIRPLGIEYLDFVSDNYSLHLDREYIAERLISGEVFGAFLDGEISGFIGRHDEGAMGMLEVMPDKRRMGLATALMHYLINHILALGEIPYGQIKTHNTASLELNKKIQGSVIAPEKIAWLFYK
jgi:tRNA (guanine37-N1)-methyltransferase